MPMARNNVLPPPFLRSHENVTISTAVTFFPVTVEAVASIDVSLPSSLPRPISF